MSDNGPQYSASQFSKFAKEYGFTHTTSSPKYPQANGAAERAVKTVKELLDKNADPYLALLDYRSTPLENGYSPAQLLMGRNLRTSIPILPRQLTPKLPNSSLVKEKEKEIKERQKGNFDRRHRATNLRPLQPGDTVWIQGSNSEGRVVEQSNTRSYVVETPEGESVRRNRRHLRPIPNSDRSETTDDRADINTNSGGETSEQFPDNSIIKTRSGRISKPPVRYEEQI